MIGFVHDEIYKRHYNEPGHPESPSRLDAVSAAIDRFTSEHESKLFGNRTATMEELGLIHRSEYIRAIAETANREETRLDYETSASRFSFEAASKAVGSTIDAIESMLEGGVTATFSAVRPPGHHAESDKAMGFCIFNTAAIAARAAIDRLGVRRVAIVDWDVHHGNGTMHSLYDTDEVLYISIHQFPHYPGTGLISDVGSGKGEGFTINAPMPPGSGDASYEAAFTRIFVPVLRSYEPDLLIVSAGYDAHVLDSMSAMRLSSEAYGRMTGQLLGAYDSKSRFAVVLEGGYDFTALEEGVEHTLAAINGRNYGAELYGDGISRETGREVESDPPGVAAEGARVIEALARELSPYWPGLSG